MREAGPRPDICGPQLFGFAAFAAALYPRQRTLPDPAQPGNGAEVRVTLFTKDGNHKQVVSLKNLMLQASDWRRNLTGDEFAITRRKGTEFAFANRYWNCHDRVCTAVCA